MIAGVDNGLDGGIVFLNDDGTVHHKHVMPTVTLGKKGNKRKTDGHTLRAYFTFNNLANRDECERLTHVFVERAQPMPGQGVVSMFSIGKGSGIVEGLLIGLQIPFTEVVPQTWMKEMFKGLPKEGKDTTKLVARRLWPVEDWRASERCKVPHDGLCDAALIAEYGRRLLKGQINNA